MTRRRKYIVWAIVLLVLIWLGFGLSGRPKNTTGSDQPEYAKIERGNLDVPISATGTVEPASRTEIKCKASGTVEAVYFDASDMVKKGDLLIKLDPVDEQRSVDNARVDYSRAQSNLALAESELQQVKRDWPTKVETALAGINAARASLQGAVVSFKKNDEIRLGGKTDKKTVMDVFDINKIKPTILDNATDDPRVELAGKQIAVSLLESKEVTKLVDYGKAIINDWKESGVTFVEYQDALITMWQTQAKLWAAMADLHNAVNLRILIDQAQTKVKLGNDALRTARVQLDQAEQRLKDTKVYAPSDGLVQEVFIKKGQIISSGITTFTGGTPLMILADVSKLYVVSDVDEADIGRVRDLAPLERSSWLGFLLGNKNTSQPAPKLTPENEQEMALLRSSNNVDVTVDAFREDTFTGKVDRVEPSPKNVNNIVTYNVRILLTSPNRTQLMLGMHANVKFTSRKLTNVLLVKSEAIKIKNEERGVFIDGPNKTPLFVPVKVGLSDGTMIELKTDKLQVGQTVYIKLPAAVEEKGKESD